MGAFQRMHHTGFTVTDLDRSIAFYRDRLGCELVMRQEKRGGYLAAIVGYPDAHVKMAHLRLRGGGHIIELFEYLSPAPEPVMPEPRRVGNAHVCFLVDDLRATYERLRAQGVDFVSPPVEVDTGVNRGALGLYLRDPDGITVELLQRAPGKNVASGAG
jgi:catechol 2,3-dioxygenase-like lactoylglutathione lyase family enzyme